MATLKLVEYPHPILKQVTTPVVTFDETLQANAQEMFALLYEEGGTVGLAANQVGLSARFFVMDTSQEQNSPICLVNPEIISKEGEGLSQEGCLSLPNLFLSVPRAKKVTVKYQDVKGQEQILEAEGLTAFCIQHELDHLNGILAIDHFSKLKKTLYLKKMEKARRFEESA